MLLVAYLTGFCAALKYVGFEVIMAATVKISVCGDVMLCRLVDCTSVSGELAAPMFRVKE
jgi:hypothetical protein